jgi:site-specific recombinase XerD
VVAIPSKRYTKPLLGCPSREEMQAVLNTSDGATWAGHRDRVLFGVMYSTGARVSEIIRLHRDDVISAEVR